MKKLFLALATFLAASIAFCSCNKELSTNVSANEAVSEIVGSADFFSSISYLNNFTTKSGEVSAEEVIEEIQPLFVSAKEYLTLNGYNYREDFEENDPNIILTAYALMEMDFVDQLPETKISVSTALSCVFLGEPVANLAKTGAALIAKRVASKVLERAIPYVGAAVWVATSAVCIYDNWENIYAPMPSDDDSEDSIGFDANISGEEYVPRKTEGE